MNDSDVSAAAAIPSPFAPPQGTAQRVNFARKFGLKPRLILVVLTAFVPVVVAYGWLVSHTAQVALSAGRAQLLRLTADVAERQGDVLESARDVLAALALDPAWDLDTCNAHLTLVRARFEWLAGLAAVSPHGQLMCSSLPAPRAITVAREDFFRRALSARSFAVGDLRRGDFTGLPIINVAMPVFAGDGSVATVLVAAIRASWFERLLREGRLPAGANVYVFDASGNVLAQLGRVDPPGLADALFRRARAGIAAGAAAGEVDRPAVAHDDGLYIYRAFAPFGGLLVVGQPSGPLLSEVQRGAVIWGLSLALSLALGVALAWVAAEFLVLRSARRLLAATVVLAEGKVSGLPRARNEPCELGELAMYFRIMADAIRQREHETMRAMNEAISARQAEASFLAQVSHELRTPLNAIMGFSEVIRDQTVGAGVPAVYRDYAADIHTAGEHLLSLVNDILTLGRARSPEAGPAAEDVDLAAEIAVALAGVRMEAKRKGLALTCEVPGDLPHPTTDRRSVRQILLNLLSNAVKFTPAGGSARLSAERVGNRVRLRVVDTGIGMDEAQRARLFKPFSTAGKGPYVTAGEGSGLGLYITRQLVETLGGSVEIASTPGGGTTATVEIPLAGDPALERSAIPSLEPPATP